jgi:hypothetical protein
MENEARVGIIGATIFSIMTLGITTLSILSLHEQRSANDAVSFTFFTVVLSVINPSLVMLNVFRISSIIMSVVLLSVTILRTMMLCVITLSIVMLSIVMLIAIMLSVIMLSVAKLRVNMLSVDMLSVDLLSVILEDALYWVPWC